MSTIASPRESSLSGRRIPQITTSTPTTSTRPSLDLPRRTSPSPSSAQPRRNRAALRSYYNLPTSTPSLPSIASSDAFSETSSIHSNDDSSTLLSELDSPSFVSSTYISHALETQSLAELLKTYNAVLTDIRALDAEKKALVYDNYSKLIAATETIGRMRSSMDVGDPVARRLDLVLGGVWERAEGLRREIRGDIERGREGKEKERERNVVRGVLEAPRKVRELVEEGRIEDARKLWGEKFRLLERWRERGVGGREVERCIEEGETALRGGAVAEA